MRDSELLRSYVNSRNELAFAEIVQRHAAWVYSSATRQLKDAHLAEDVTQAVFLLLARKARKLTGYAYLHGWLLKTLRYCVMEARRERSRRQSRESEAAMIQQQQARSPAWGPVAEVLDDAVAKLRPRDRHAVMLRYYQGMSLADVATELGITTEAARKRVDRALDKLKGAMAAKGIGGLAGLGELLTARATVPAPQHLLHSLASTGASAEQGGAAAIAKGAMKIMFWAKMKLAATILAIMGVGAGAAALAQTTRHLTSSDTTTIAATESATTRPVIGEYRIGGGVPRPGVYHITGRSVTVLQALAATGLDLGSPDPKAVNVIRHDSAGRSERVYRLSVAELMHASGDLVLEPNDEVQVVEQQAWAEPPTRPFQWREYYVSGVARSGVYSLSTGSALTMWQALISAGWQPEDDNRVLLVRRKHDGTAETRRLGPEDLKREKLIREQVMPGDVIVVLHAKAEISG